MKTRATPAGHSPGYETHSLGAVPETPDGAGYHGDDSEPAIAAPDPVAAELEAALDMRRTGADAKALRRALRRIEELLDE